MDSGYSEPGPLSTPTMATSAQMEIESGPASAESLADPGGYDLSLLLTPASERFLCSHCHLVLREPVQTMCGHHYCNSCLKGLTSSGEDVECQACKDEGEAATSLTKTMKFPDKALQREIEQLQVKCNHKPCDWRGKLRHYQGHLEDCQFAPIVCSNCGMKVARNEMAAHEDPANGLCVPQLVCPYGCLEKIPADNFRSHMEAHVPEHLENIVARVIDVQSKVTSVETSQEQLRKQIMDDLMKSNEDLTQKQSQVVERVNQLESQMNSQEQGRSASRGAVGGASIAEDDSMEILEGGSDAFGNQKITVLQDVVLVLHKELNRKMETMSKSQETDHRKIMQLESLVKELERTLMQRTMTISDLEQRCKALEVGSVDGNLMWKITNVAQRREEARQGMQTSMYSPVFYTSPTGYKMCARLYLNGDGMGKGTHLSLFFVIMRGQYDPLLPWPFRQKVSLRLINQVTREHHMDAFRPDPTSSSFARPSTDMNIASGCPLFITHSELNKTNNPYIVDDTMFIHLEVDRTGLKSPGATASSNATR